MFETLPLMLIGMALYRGGMFDGRMDSRDMRLWGLIGLGIGPMLMGFLSDEFITSYGAESLRYAAVLCLAFYVIAGVLALMAARSLQGDWVEEGAS